MAVKIRLQRHGKKDSAFFHVVVADGRAPRDGAFIEKLGTYNPNTNPMKKHLLGGVSKGAHTAEQAEAKFEKWLASKEGKVTAKKDRLSKEDSDAKSAKLKAETAVKEAKAAKIAAKATASETSSEAGEAPATEENA